MLLGEGRPVEGKLTEMPSVGHKVPQSQYVKMLTFMVRKITGSVPDLGRSGPCKDSNVAPVRRL